MPDQVAPPTIPSTAPRPPPRWGAMITTAFSMSMALLSAVLLMRFAIPPENRDAVLMLVGAIIAWNGSSVNYWQGSSAGSAAKDVQLAAAQQAAQKSSGT